MNYNVVDRSNKIQLEETKMIRSQVTEEVPGLVNSVVGDVIRDPNSFHFCTLLFSVASLIICVPKQLDPGFKTFT